MSILDELPEAVPVRPALFRVPRSPVDVYVEEQGSAYLVFSPIGNLAGSPSAPLFSYLLERNASRRVMPGAFALYEGKIIYRLQVEEGQLEQACRRALEVAVAYAPKILPML